VDVDPRKQAIADAYEAMKHDPANPEVQKSYAALIDGVNQQWEYATKNSASRSSRGRARASPTKTRPR